jgi:hypothetical protein
MFQGGALFSFLGIGAGDGSQETTFSCPKGTVVTGFSGGQAYYAEYVDAGYGTWVSGVQFYCSGKSARSLHTVVMHAAPARPQGGLVIKGGCLQVHRNKN